MKSLIQALVLVFAAAFATSAFATDCAAQAAEKKLHGAAKNSFVKKCERNNPANTECTTKAAEKKLHGAAKNSFVKKCVADAGK